MVERATRHLAERLGKEAVAAHHGSLSKEKRLDAEQRLKAGELRALVATASLELGIDIGEVDLVCQLGSPRSIAAFLQRAGRSGHAVDGMSKARLFPTSRDDLAECAALLDCVRRGELDTLHVPLAPLDVLAQQIVAEVACGECDEDALFALVRGAHPYRELTRGEFAEVRAHAGGGLQHAARQSRGLSPSRCGERQAARAARRAAHRDHLRRRDSRHRRLRRGAGARVAAHRQRERGFRGREHRRRHLPARQTSYRILRVERGRVRVEDAQGAPPTIPFWLGEAPGRSDELSFAVSRLREEISARLAAGEEVLAWLRDEVGVVEAAARQLVEYYQIARTELGLLPTQSTLAFERFFDESGGTQLVIHSPHGSRLNRAWGLALRKRFCRKFNFELQAAATEDAIVLSLSTSHSFPLEEVARYLHSNSVREVLTQALLDAPMFALRWRWNAGAALALPRFVGGAKVAPQLQRMKSEDLLATVFPDQVACLENIVGERRIPDHPLVDQTLHDCLLDAMDLEGLIALLKKLESGAVRVVARDLTAPSALSAEVLGARPYAYLDDAPLEERRTQAVSSRGFGSAERAEDLGRLDADAIAGVREEAWPQPRDADEMHEALLSLGAVNRDEARGNPGWERWLAELADARRATCLDAGLWVAAEALPMWRAALPDASLHPAIEAPREFAEKAWTREESLVEILRARLGCLGPARVASLAGTFSLPPDDIAIALGALEREGFVMRGRFAPDASTTHSAQGRADSANVERLGRDRLLDARGRRPDASIQDDEEWCERHLLARIHRRTLQRLRREIEPVEPRDFMRFLFHWQHVAPDSRLRGAEALSAVLAQLEGFEAPAGAWESQLLPTRLQDYDIGWLDALCGAGRIAWTRLRASNGGHAAPVRASPIVLLPRKSLATWSALGSASQEPPALSSRAQCVADWLAQRGASFFDEIESGAHLLRVETEDALAELVGAGLVGADSFSGLRAMLLPSSKRNGARHRRLRRNMLSGIEDAGRWSLIRRAVQETGSRHAYPAETLEHIARALLRRWGVVFWTLLAREAPWLPPWRELRRVYQRLEARGEIRGGRFVAGMAGEQFALPEAIGTLRNARKAHDESLIAISGADPLNLTGSVLAGDKVPALASSRIAFRDGLPLARRVAGEIALMAELSIDDERKTRALLRGLRPDVAVEA